jgi:hypothetical protein
MTQHALLTSRPIFFGDSVGVIIAVLSQHEPERGILGARYLDLVAAQADAGSSKSWRVYSRYTTDLYGGPPHAPNQVFSVDTTCMHEP